jgi:hypothetical protein
VIYGDHGVRLVDHLGHVIISESDPMISKALLKYDDMYHEFGIFQAAPKKGAKLPFLDKLVRLN